MSYLCVGFLYCIGDMGKLSETLIIYVDWTHNHITTLLNHIKQWFSYLRQAYPEAKDLFREIRTFNKAAPIVEHIQRYRDELNSQVA